MSRKDQPFDIVEKPIHYNSSPSGKECVELCELLTFNLGNALKYVWRSGMKDEPLRDLKKSAWYLRRHLKNSTDSDLMIPDFADEECADRFARLAAEVIEHEENGTVLHVLLNCLAYDTTVQRAIERVEHEIAALEAEQQASTA